jgi:hypothetical protein
MVFIVFRESAIISQIYIKRKGKQIRNRLQLTITSIIIPLIHAGLVTIN